MTKRISFLLTAIILLTATVAYAAKIFDGYEELKWGTDIHQVMQAYPKGAMGDYQKEVIYTQDNPDETISSRIFAFKEGKLTSVAVTFSAGYVKKTGLENLKQTYMKQYGKGKQVGQESKAHMISYVWDGKKTRVSFVYVPNRPEMTVMQYEQKAK
jgi:hypothetical protein